MVGNRRMLKTGGWEEGETYAHKLLDLALLEALLELLGFGLGESATG
jgi:hypothetical protein